MIFAEHPEVKKQLWGGELWSDGYFVATVGKNTNEDVIAQYVKEQGKQDLSMFIKEPDANETPFYLFETDKILAEESKGVRYGY